MSDMQEYRPRPFDDIDEAIKQFVDHVRTAKQVMWGDFNEVHLIADPAVKGDEYSKQLLWTYLIVDRDSEYLDRKWRNRRRWVNLVPEVQAVAKNLMAEYETLDWADMKAVIDWLARYALPACCQWTNTREQTQRIAKQLERTKADRFYRYDDPATPRYKTGAFADAEHLIEAAIALFNTKSRNWLPPGWLAAAHEWLAKKG
jgi:hypothetical protein